MASSPVVATDRVAATYPADRVSVRSARELVATALRRWGADELVDDATLLVSELVTNAVVHAGTSVEAAALLLADTVEVAVTDRHPTRALPSRPRQPDPDREGGRGLALLAALAAVWGVEYTDRTKRVWFRLPLPVATLPGPREPDDSVTDAPAEDVPLALACVLLDDAGLVTDLDVHAEELLGRDRVDVVGRPWLEMCADADAGDILTAAAVPRWQGSYRVRPAAGPPVTVTARHVRLAGQTPDQPWRTLCVLVDHRLRAVLGEPADPRSLAAPATASGPFADAPDRLVRLELSELLDHTARWVREAFDADAAYALLVSDDEDEFEVRSVVGPEPARLRWRLPADAALPQLREDLVGHPGSDDWLAETDARSAVRVPLVAAGRLTGALVVASERPAAFTLADGSRLQQVADGVALAVQSGRVAEIDRRRHGWLSFLAEASELLAGTLELDMALALVAQLVAPRLGPWCAVFLATDGERVESAIAWHSDEEQVDDLRAAVAAAAPPAPPPRSLVRWSAGTAWPAHAVALIARGRVIGSLVVGRGADEGDRRTGNLLADLAPRVALALDNARLYAERTAISRTLQRSLLPPELPDLPEVEVGVVYEAMGAGLEVGGDFFDIFRTAPVGAEGPDPFAFAVGDVCGKGPEAAAVTGLARTALRVLGRRGEDVPLVLRDLNTAILAEGERARFLTLVYGTGEVREDGGLRLALASAGHPLPVVVRADGTVETVGRTGDLLGVFSEPSVVVSGVELAPGEALVCFTDGVTERRSGAAMLGDEGVAAAVSGCQDLPAPALARRLEAAVRGFGSQPARDDVAILVLRSAPLKPRRRPG